VAEFRITGCGSLSEALEIMNSAEGRVSLVAGGTDFVRKMRNEGIDCGLILDISQAADMRYILEEHGCIRIGACTSFAEIASSALLREKAACLAQAASQVGSVQIRNRATIGGNIASGSPAADSLPPLTVLHATAELMVRKPGFPCEPQEMPVHICSSRLHDEGIITEIRFPAPPPHCRTGFVKLGSRTAVSIARLSMAMRVHYNAQANEIEEGLIALGALGEDPVCPDDLQEFLSGKRVDRSFAEQLIHRLTEVVDGAIPGRESRPYKRVAVGGLAVEMLQNLFSISLDPG